MNYNELIIGILCTAVFFLLIMVIALGWKSFQHNESLKRHERSVRLLSRRNNKGEDNDKDTTLNNIEEDVNAILRETKGFAHFCKYACWVLIPICLIATIHHFVVFFPRLLNAQSCEQGQSGYAHLGVDYLGIIVAMFAIIITILVTWNIYSTIKAKEELRGTKEDVEKLFEKRIEELDVCCKQGRNKLEELEREHNSFEQDTNKKINNLRANILKFMGITWSANLLAPDKSDMFQSMLSTYIGSIKEYVQNNEIDKANLVLFHMMEDARVIKKDVTLPISVKESITKKFTEITNYERLRVCLEFFFRIFYGGFRDGFAHADEGVQRAA